MSEQIENAIEFAIKRISKEKVLFIEKVKLYKELSKQLLVDKYISKTMFDKDKEQIKNIILIETGKIARFSIITKNNNVFQIVTFEQLQELVELGASQEDESDFINNCLYIVK
jgi:hypothetical protein